MDSGFSDEIHELNRWKHSMFRKQTGVTDSMTATVVFPFYVDQSPSSRLIREPINWKQVLERFRIISP